MRLHHALDVVEAVDRELAEGRVDRPIQEPGQLDDRHAEVLPGAPGQPAVGRRWKVGKGQRQVREGGAATPDQRQVGHVPEAAPRREGHRRRQSGDGGGESANEGYAERRRRSRTSSTTIGISDSTITITTTTWR